MTRDLRQSSPSFGYPEDNAPGYFQGLSREQGPPGDSHLSGPLGQPEKPGDHYSWAQQSVIDKEYHREYNFLYYRRKQ
jgi:hypothetical protein